MLRRRVVITGMGCITPLGHSPGELWPALLEGRSGVAPLTLFDASRFPVRIAAEVKDWSPRNVGIDGRFLDNAPRQTQFALAAGLQAIRHAGLPSNRVSPRRLGVYLGVGEPFEDFTRFTASISDAARGGACADDAFLSSALRIFDPETEREYEPHRPATHLAGLVNAQGPVLNCIAACASSTQAIGEAARLIRRGEVDAMLAGGAHSTIHPFGVTGFHRLSALSTRNDDPRAAVRPFDADRDGFVIGEGGAVFVLEELEHARRRGAEILGEIAGYGSAQDAFRVTDSAPDGRGTVLAIRRALADAALNAEDIDYVNAHGTGTLLNDRIETIALKTTFGPAAGRVPISSTKSMLGHSTTACGAIELAVCLMTVRDAVVHPTINYATPDPQCDLDYVPNVARELDVRHVLSPSIGFGGQNAALVVSRFDESSRSAAAQRAA
ncbi:MAG: beta-ketoacyl-[acyl-carrier-protein] synthase family protein [Planctomycetes bacterium]|nr:beta-ketoacyl-[acyl-carrier-protein] synthase family protein [Planctomycetota bacterium]